MITTDVAYMYILFCIIVGAAGLLSFAANAFVFLLCHRIQPFRSTSMLMFGHLVRKTQANDLNDNLEFSRSCRKLLNAIIVLCYRCAHVAHLYIVKRHRLQYR